MKNNHSCREIIRNIPHSIWILGIEFQIPRTKKSISANINTICHFDVCVLVRPVLLLNDFNLGLLNVVLDKN